MLKSHFSFKFYWLKVFNFLTWLSRKYIAISHTVVLGPVTIREEQIKQCFPKIRRILRYHSYISKIETFKLLLIKYTKCHLRDMELDLKGERASCFRDVDRWGKRETLCIPEQFVTWGCWWFLSNISECENCHTHLNRHSFYVKHRQILIFLVFFFFS
jgi:hypothetical protein